MSEDDDAPLPSADALFDGAACGLLLTDRRGLLLRVNRTFCHWVGSEPEALVGTRRLQDLLTMGGRIFHQTHWAPLLQLQGSIAEVKLEVRHRDGHAVPMLMNAVAREHGGRVLHEIALFVSEERHRYERELVASRRQAEALLLKEYEAQRALAATQAELSLQHDLARDRALFAEQMVGIVSHDLRNPLHAIQLSAALMNRGSPDIKQARLLAGITKASARAERLIADLLDFTQARVGQGLPVTPAAIDLHAVVAASVEELALAFPARTLLHRRVGVGVEPGADVGEETVDGTCRADADRVTQAIGNLVANAVAYGDPAGPITVTSRVGPARAEIAVHNRGEPVPATLLPKLFDAMTRGDRAASHGVGLGLFIVREIARAHGGDVGVVSSAGDGTVFTLELARGPG